VRTRSRSLRIAPGTVAAGLLAALLAAPAVWAQATLQEPAPVAAPEIAPGTEPLCTPEVIGQRRIPKDSVLARMASHQGDPYDPETVERDFNSIWNTGYFEKVWIERYNQPATADTPACVQLVVHVTEKPTIRTIDYQGLNAVTVSDVDERFKKAKVGLVPESQFDYTRVMRAVSVLKDLLSEHGHQFSTITPVIKTIPPSSVGLTFKIKEGPTVKVGKISFDGNYNLSNRILRDAMVNSRPIGIPHSIILEDLFAKTFDASKLDEDTERVAVAYRDRGYANAETGEAQTHVRDSGGLNWFTLRPSNGKRIDIMIPVEEGERYRLGGITFSGIDAKQWNLKALRAQFPLKDGDWYNFELMQKGLKALRDAFGSRGYINMVADPQQKRDDAKHLVYWNIDVNEDKQFLVSRIEFSGNTRTRDKVIRRELVLEEGQIYSKQLWDLSILRLNQLGYFDTLKVDDDTETHQDPDNGTVELLLKIKEKGQNSIGVNGGISGLSGTFVGLEYSTNNFLGLGETLSANANVGDLQRNLSFGFNEPYLRNKPISVGVQLFTRKTDYNPAKAYSISNGTAANISTAQQSLLTNYNSATTGFTVYASEPLKHLFAGRGVSRIGINYGLSRASVTTFNDNTRNIFQSLAFRSGVEGPNQLNGIVTSTIAPSFSYSSLDRPIGATTGRDFNVSVQVAGAGGNVKYISPVATLRQYYRMKGLKLNPEGRNDLQFRLQLAHVSGFGGEVAPPTNRLYGGGETDLRGFDVRAASPYTFVPVKVNFNLTNPDGQLVPIDTTQPNLGTYEQIPLPIYRPVAVGGDSQLTFNMQYQIPIVSTVSFNFFSDFGMTGDLQKGQLRQSVSGASVLASPQYGCTSFNGPSCLGGQKILGFSPLQLNTMPHTNFVPRMSVGAEIQAILPIINAPIRLFYAYNPLRLYRDVPQQLALPNTCAVGQTACFQNLFPATDAGRYSYQQALEAYGPSYQLREPRKTFRLTVGTTF
jgi:outer membrane protein insertion porin family